MNANHATHDLIAVEDLMRELAAEHDGQAAKAALSHLQSGGKRTRAKLALAASDALGLSSGASVAIAASSELIHNASLIHDDIQDRSLTRRDSATLWSEYGKDTAICAGDLLISAGYAALAVTGTRHTTALLRRMHARIAEVIYGQCEDLQSRNSAIKTVSEYEKVARAKSAPLLALPVELALIAAERPDACSLVGKAVDAFAIAYQMADDIEDVVGDIELGQPNIVAVLGGRDPHSAQADEARNMAAEKYLQSAKIADTLPSRSGALLAAFARKGAGQLELIGAAA